MNILVTGGAGFIGSAVVDELVFQGHTITVIDNFDPFYSRKLKERNCVGFLEKVTFIEADISNPETIHKLFDFPKFDIIIHLASKAGVRPSIIDPISYFNVNVNSTIHLFEFAKKSGIEKFILASSSSVYGINEKIPFSEKDPIQQSISPYAASKIAAEQVAHTYAHIFGISVTILRFFTVYGPRQRPDLAIHKFAKKILENQAIPVYGDGNSARDYTFVKDIVQGVLGAVDFAGKSNFEVFNLGESRVISLKSLIESLESALQKKALIEYMPMQAGDVPITYADISKARKYLNYNPNTSFESGIHQFVEWLKNQPEAD